MSRNDEIIWDFFRYIVSLTEDEFIIFCECFNDERLPTECKMQFIEKVNSNRILNVINCSPHN